MRKKIKNGIVLFLILSVLMGVSPAESVHAASGSVQKRTEDFAGEPADPASAEPVDTEGATPPAPAVPTMPAAVETPAPTQMPVPVQTPIPVQTPSSTPAATAKPTPTPDYGAYKLLTPQAKYYKGGQKGIHYKKAKGKVYHILSYTTDSVKLSMSHGTEFSVYGGKNKKMVKKKYVKVSASGVVKVGKKWQGEEWPVVIRAKSKKTGEVQYIYLRLREKLSCTPGSLSLYEKHTQSLKFNYGKKKLDFTVGNKKIATIDNKGKVTAGKRGKTWLTVKVEDSENNKIRIRIKVKEEPWIVDSKNKVYDYDDMKKDMYRLKSKYSGKMGVFSIGQSWDDRSIYCMRVGNSNASRELIIDGGIHAREWKNVQILMKQTEDLLRNYAENRERFQSTCLYIIPMANPDGVSLAQYGFGAIRDKKLQKRCKKIGHHSTWKNNARGVNLNYNFPAGFSKKKKSKKPDYYSYPGKKAGSEKETQAMMKFANRIKPDAVLNVHSMGSVIYWNFDVTGEAYQRQYNLASKIHSFTRYTMMPKSGSTHANGGFADWLVYDRKITSVTVETGTVACPLPHSQFNPIYKRTNEMFMWFMTKY